MKTIRIVAATSVILAIVSCFTWTWARVATLLQNPAIHHHHAGPDFRPSDPAEIPPPAGRKLEDLTPEQLARMMDELAGSVAAHTPGDARYILVIFDAAQQGKAHVASNATIDQLRAVGRGLLDEIEPVEDPEPGLDVPAAGKGGPR